jgi:hypothetical protein
MAVFQGARLRSTALPAADSAARFPRVSAPPTVDAIPRVRPMGLLMAGIVTATMLGLVYLTQTLGSNVTTQEIRSLDAQRQELHQTIRRNAVAVQDVTDADVITIAARGQKLKRLGGVLVLPAP